MRICIVVPCYEKHADLLEKTLANYSSLELPFIIIDDASSSHYQKIVAQVADQYQATLIRRDTNGGKGAAVTDGLKKAHALGFDLALQIDSDGQHDPAAVHQLLELAKKNPEKLISGQPIYDESIPKGRYYGRYLTHVWVWIETLSFTIKDSMCGYRSYPLKKVIPLLTDSLGKRMDFDIEIMVRSYWAGLEFIFFPIKVHYPKDGTSYFSGFHDNVLISKMHTRLFFGMLYRLPTLLYRKIFGNTQVPWHKKNERGSLFFMRFTLFVFFMFGEKSVRLLTKLIAFYYSLFSSKAKSESVNYKEIYRTYCKSHALNYRDFTFYQHVLSFADTIIDKAAAWKGRITPKNIAAKDLEVFYQATVGKERGALFISSHYGNIDVARACGSNNQNVKFNALMYTANSQKITQLINEINPQSALGIISVENFGPELGALLREKIDNKEHLFCMGDRVTINSDKTIATKLLERDVSLPMGPFLLSYLLRCPTYAFHCFREGAKFRVSVVEITPEQHKNRSDYITTLADSYTQQLEKLITQDPTQWYNFNNLWHQHDKI